MKHLKHHQIDKSKWDNCIYSSKEQLFYAYSWYLDCVSPRWEGIILEEGDQYLAVLPLPVRKKYGIRFLQKPLFAQQLGIFSIRKLSESQVRALLHLLHQQYRLISNYPFNTTNFEEFEAVFKAFAKELEIPLKTHKTHHLSLLQDYPTIQQAYKRDTRYRIKQAKKQGYSIVRKKGEDDIDLLWKLFEKSVSLENGISPQAPSTLKDIFNVLSQKGLAELFYIQNRSNEIVSGVLFAKSSGLFKSQSKDSTNTKWIYLFNAANTRDESRRWFLDRFIQNKAQLEGSQSHSEREKLILDFESAQQPSIARYYASFGSEEKPFFLLDYNRLPSKTKLLQRLVQLLKQLM